RGTDRGDVELEPGGVGGEVAVAGHIAPPVDGEFGIGPDQWPDLRPDVGVGAGVDEAARHDRHVRGGAARRGGAGDAEAAGTERTATAAPIAAHRLRVSPGPIAATVPSVT